MNILYLAFGHRSDIYLQTIFSCESLLAIHKKDVKVHIFTDNPQKFERIKDYVKLHHFSVEEVEEEMYVNGIRYFFRIKLKLIERFVLKYPNESLMFLDSDTFVYKSLNDIFEIVKQGKAVMHEPERLFSKPETKTDKHVWRKLRNKSIAGIPITKDTMGWNSGVIGIPTGNNLAIIQKSIEVCDELIMLCKRRSFVEQNAYSIVFANMCGIEKANQCIAHYWGNKEEWNEQIVKFYLESLLANLSIGEEIELTKKLNLKDLPYRRKTSNTKKRLVKIVSRLFKDKKLEYIAN